MLQPSCPTSEKLDESCPVESLEKKEMKGSGQFPCFGKSNSLFWGVSNSLFSWIRDLLEEL
jgi:hypothetical protein